MSFLRLSALWALPLVVLPVVVHLLHRRRHPAVKWAATMFLRRATASRRGPARLRRYAILAARVLVLTAIVFATARPLSTGWFGFSAGKVAGRNAISIVILDRSPSMLRRMGNAAPTRLEMAKRHVAESLQTLDVEKFVVIESVGRKPIRMSDPKRLIDAPMTEGAASTSDIPGMLLDALTLLTDSNRRVADVWICSDRQESDWNPQAAEWDGIRRRLNDAGKGVRFHVLEFVADRPKTNASLQVTDVRAIENDGETMVSLAIALQSDEPAASIPLRVNVNGQTIVTETTLREGVGGISDYQVPVDGPWNAFYGSVSIPADGNDGDNEWFFVAPSATTRQLVLVSEDDCKAVRAAAEVLGNVSEVVREDLNSDRLASIACVIWQGELPTDESADVIESFVRSGGSVVFFPSQRGTSGDFEGVSFGDFRNEQGFSSSFREYEFSVEHFAPVIGSINTVAAIPQRGVVIGSLNIGSGAVVFCGMDVVDADSSFVEDGVVLYGLLLEAIDDGTRRRFGAGSHLAGSRLPEEFESQRESVVPVWMGESGADGSYEFGHHAGIFALGRDASETRRLVAINRSTNETSESFVSDEELGLPWSNFTWNRIPIDGVTSVSQPGLVREVWVWIWWGLIILLVGEAWLSLPPSLRGLP